MALALPAVAGLALSGCAGAGGGGGGGGSDAKSLTVLMVGNPQMVDIQKLTKDNFTKDTGIKVHYTVLPENELRDKVTQDVATGAGQYDVATVGATRCRSGRKTAGSSRSTSTPTPGPSTRPTCSSRSPSHSPGRTASCTHCRSTVSPPS